MSRTRRTDSPLHDADWSLVNGEAIEVAEPNPVVEKLSGLFCLALLVGGIVAYWALVVRPNDEKFVRLLDCVGDRAPTAEVVRGCAG